MAGEAREKLLDAAYELFYAGGIHATGVDRVVERAGVTRMTLYKYFPSKNDLILAVLERKSEQWSQWFLSRVDAQTPDPVGRLLAIFDVLEEGFRDETWCGCPFINAAAEFSDQVNPAHCVAAKHVLKLRGIIEHLAVDAHADNPVELAAQICLLVEGAIVIRTVAGDTNAATSARTAATMLMRAHGIKICAGNVLQSI